MKVESFSAFESSVLSFINKGINTFDGLLEVISFGERTLTQTLEGLQSKNIIIEDNRTNNFKYAQPLEKEVVILEGNILLPTTIIRLEKKGIMYISRGEWYQFPIDFDPRRIIWNVKLASKNNSTLVDLIRTSVLKQRKTSITHNKDYDNIKNKIVPYCKNYGLYINKVGDEITDVDIMFKIIVDPTDEFSPVFKGFRVNTEISTQELLNELTKPVSERNYEQNIKLNKIYNFSDFVTKDNEIPISFNDKVLQYIKINSANKNTFGISYYMFGKDGNSKLIEKETFDDMNEGFQKIRNLFQGFASQILIENDMLCEMTE